MTGTVKWFDAKKGFGFITPDQEDADDVFVHHTAIQCRGFRTLREGDTVEFLTEWNQKGQQAIDVRVIGCRA